MRLVTSEVQLCPDPRLGSRFERNRTINRWTWTKPRNFTGSSCPLEIHPCPEIKVDAACICLLAGKMGCRCQATNWMLNVATHTKKCFHIRPANLVFSIVSRLREGFRPTLHDKNSIQNRWILHIIYMMLTPTVTPTMIRLRLRK